MQATSHAPRSYPSDDEDACGGPAGASASSKGGASGSGGPVFGVPLSQCVEAAPWRKRSACTSTSTTGMDIPEIMSPTVSKASRSDSRISVGSSISVQDRVILLLIFIYVEH